MGSIQTQRLIIIFLVSSVILLEEASGSDDLMLSVDGVHCSSCGAKCSLVCGSRQFKSCCLNFVKKRSYPKIRAVFRRGGELYEEQEPIREPVPTPPPQPPWTEQFRTLYLRKREENEGKAEKSRIAIADDPTEITIDQHFILEKVPESPPGLQGSHQHY